MIFDYVFKTSQMVISDMTKYSISSRKSNTNNKYNTPVKLFTSKSENMAKISLCHQIIS